MFLTITNASAAEATDGQLGVSVEKVANGPAMFAGNGSRGHSCCCRSQSLTLVSTCRNWRTGPACLRARLSNDFRAATARERLREPARVRFAGELLSLFPAVKLNLHARTNMDVIARFLPVRFETTEASRPTKVEVLPCS